MVRRRRTLQVFRLHQQHQQQWMHLVAVVLVLIHLLLSVSQVVPERRPIRRRTSSLEMNTSLQSSAPVMVGDLQRCYHETIEVILTSEEHSKPRCLKFYLTNQAAHFHHLLSVYCTFTTRKTRLLFTFFAFFLLVFCRYPSLWCKHLTVCFHPSSCLSPQFWTTTKTSSSSTKRFTS